MLKQRLGFLEEGADVCPAWLDLLAAILKFPQRHEDRITDLVRTGAAQVVGEPAGVGAEDEVVRGDHGDGLLAKRQASFDASDCARLEARLLARSGRNFKFIQASRSCLGVSRSSSGLIS